MFIIRNFTDLYLNHDQNLMDMIAGNVYPPQFFLSDRDNCLFSKKSSRPSSRMSVRRRSFFVF